MALVAALFGVLSFSTFSYLISPNTGAYVAPIYVRRILLVLRQPCQDWLLSSFLQQSSGQQDTRLLCLA
jgi:hypothetical protein